jgi:hypothetical protein
MKKIFPSISLMIAIGVIWGTIVFAENTSTQSTAATQPISTKYVSTACNSQWCTYLPLIFRVQDLVIADTDILPCKGGMISQVTIFNTSDRTIYNAVLTIQLYDNQEIIDTYTGTTGLVATFPGETNLNQKGVQNDFDEIEANITSWEYEHDPEYYPVLVLSKNFTGTETCGTVFGEIKNDTDDYLSTLGIMVTGGSCGQYTLAKAGKDILAPGEITSYEASACYHQWYCCGQFYEYSAWAQGAVAKTIYLNQIYNYTSFRD